MPLLLVLTESPVPIMSTSTNTWTHHTRVSCLEHIIAASDLLYSCAAIARASTRLFASQWASMHPLTHPHITNVYKQGHNPVI